MYTSLEFNIDRFRFNPNWWKIIATFETEACNSFVILTLSQTTNIRLFELKDSVNDNFKFNENGRKFSKQVENTVGKGEIARNKQFLLSPQCFKET